MSAYLFLLLKFRNRGNELVYILPIVVLGVIIYEIVESRSKKQDKGRG